MSNNVRLVFRGEVVDGHTVDAVRRRLTEALRLEPGRAAQLFSGQPMVLNASMDEGLAQLYVQHLAQLGAKVHLEPEAAAPAPAPAAVPAAAIPAPDRSANDSDFPPLLDLPPEGPVDPPPPPWIPPLPRSASPSTSDTVDPPDWDLAPSPGAAAARPASVLPLTPPLTAPPPAAWESPPAPPPPPPPEPTPSQLAELSLEPVEQVTCPNCGERQSKRLLCRNCTTNIEMALAAQAEESQRVREARVEAMNARAGRRSAAPAAASGGAPLFGFGLDGRLGRLRYATANTASLALMYIPLIMAIQRPTLGRLALLGLSFVLLTLYGMRLAILRCHDCDKSGWWSLLLWLPTINVIVSLVLALAPGSDSSNEYGEPPPRGSGWALGAALLGLVLLVALTFSHLLRLAQLAGDRSQDDDDRIEFSADPRAASLPTPAQQAGFNEKYLAARPNKAFAISPAGAWGWADGRGSSNDAARAALQECDARREPYSAQCVVVNVNGHWVGGQ